MQIKDISVEGWYILAWLFDNLKRSVILMVEQVFFTQPLLLTMRVLFIFASLI